LRLSPARGYYAAPAAIKFDCLVAPFCTGQAISAAQIECSRQSFFAHLTDALAGLKLHNAKQYQLEMLSEQVGGSDAFRCSLEFSAQDGFHWLLFEGRRDAERIVNCKSMASNFRGPVN
jgi:hypothetical protein